jgi:aminopeptidase N
MKKLFAAALLLHSAGFAQAQLLQNKTAYTHDDSLRGSLNAHRTWWDVQRYDIEVIPDFATKSLTGKTTISWKKAASLAKAAATTADMQIDLQAPMQIDSVLYKGKPLAFRKASTNTWLVQAGTAAGSNTNTTESLIIYYHGTPREAVNPPWDGGWIWRKDKNSQPWMSVAVQGQGASTWYPCKDYQGDEPDNGASLTVEVDSALVAVANGKLVYRQAVPNTSRVRYRWNVMNPINNYCIVPYIGKYVHFSDTLTGEQGELDLDYWVLDYNLDKAKAQFTQVKPMLHCFEHWFGPYPFYEDGYKLVQSPHLGMEHQSAVAYGNGFKNGYLGRDLSGTGWGLKWDYIIVHESGHEWFANNITTDDIADMWVHEGFTMYSEVLYTQCQSGLEAANEYCRGLRSGIENDRPIIGPYGVNKEGSGDMYTKGANMIHFIRQVINNDEKFRQLLRGLNKDFYHKTVTGKEVQQYINSFTKTDFSKLFQQYLTTTQIPVLEIEVSNNKTVKYRFSNCIKGFSTPMVLKNDRNTISITPTEQWQTLQLKEGEAALFGKEGIEAVYYLTVKSPGK